MQEERTEKSRFTVLWEKWENRKMHANKKISLLKDFWSWCLRLVTETSGRALCIFNYSGFPFFCIFCKKFTWLVWNLFPSPSTFQPPTQFRKLRKSKEKFHRRLPKQKLILLCSNFTYFSTFTTFQFAFQVICIKQLFCRSHTNFA